MTRKDIVILGSMAPGVSLALACAAAGMKVTVCEPDPDARDRAEFFARRDQGVAVSGITFSSDFSAAAVAGFVFDATDPTDRRTITTALDAEATVLTTATGGPPFAAGVQAVRFVPFQPMHLRRLTEVTAFPATADSTLSQAVKLTRDIGRVAVRLPSGAASIGLRFLDDLQAATDQLLLEGAVLWELDAVMTQFGFDLGFYEAQDLIGLDMAYARRKALNKPSPISDRAVQEGRIGKKIGWGWYRYPGGGGAVIDPLIEDLIREEAWFSKTPQHTFSDDELIDKILETLRDTVRSTLAERIVTDPADLATVLVHGLGYPASRLDALNLPAPQDQRGSSAG